MNARADDPTIRGGSGKRPKGDHRRLLMLQSIYARPRMRTVESLSWQVCSGHLVQAQAALEGLARGGYLLERFIINGHHFALSAHGLACIEAGRVLAPLKAPAAPTPQPRPQRAIIEDPTMTTENTTNDAVDQFGAAAARVEKALGPKAAGPSASVRAKGLASRQATLAVHLEADLRWLCARVEANPGQKPREYNDGRLKPGGLVRVVRAALDQGRLRRKRCRLFIPEAPDQRSAPSAVEVTDPPPASEPVITEEWSAPYENDPTIDLSFDEVLSIELPCTTTPLSGPPHVYQPGPGRLPHSLEGKTVIADVEAPVHLQHPEAQTALVCPKPGCDCPRSQPVIGVTLTMDTDPVIERPTCDRGLVDCWFRNGRGHTGEKCRPDCPSTADGYACSYSAGHDGDHRCILRGAPGASASVSWPRESKPVIEVCARGSKDCWYKNGDDHAGRECKPPCEDARCEMPHGHRISHGRDWDAVEGGYAEFWPVIAEGLCGARAQGFPEEHTCEREAGHDGRHERQLVGRRKTARGTETVSSPAIRAKQEQPAALEWTDEDEALARKKLARALERRREAACSLASWTAEAEAFARIITRRSWTT